MKTQKPHKKIRATLCQTAGMNPQTLAQIGTRPAYVRVPLDRHRCPWSGLSRRTMLRILSASDAPESRLLSASGGRAGGVRLVHLESLLAWIERHSAGALAGH